MSKGELENLKEKRKQERKRKLKSLLFQRYDSFDEDDEAKKKHNLPHVHRMNIRYHKCMVSGQKVPGH